MDLSGLYQEQEFLLQNQIVPGEAAALCRTRTDTAAELQSKKSFLTEIVSEHIWVKRPLRMSSDWICPPPAEQTSNCMKYFLLQEELFIDWPCMVIRDAPGLSNIPVLSSLLYSALQKLLNPGERKHPQVPTKNIYFKRSTPQKSFKKTDIKKEQEDKRMFCNRNQRRFSLGNIRTMSDSGLSLCFSIRWSQDKEADSKDSAQTRWRTPEPSLHQTLTLDPKTVLPTMFLHEKAAAGLTL